MSRPRLLLPGLEQAAAWVVDEEVAAAADPRTRELAERRRLAIVRRRGWLVRRALLAADVAGLITAFFLAEWLFGFGHKAASPNRFGVTTEIAVFFVLLPIWVLVAKLYGLYDQDEERTDHSTADDLVPVFHMVTVGVWLFLGAAWLTRLATPEFPKLLTFWALAVASVTAARVGARRICRTRASYIQTTVIVGAGEVGQLIARKLLHHPEYGLNLIGFVDGRPEPRRGPVEHLPVIGAPDRLPAIIRTLDVERVIVAFSKESDEDAVRLVHQLKGLDVQIDIVPRMFEVVGPGIDIHTVEGVPLIGLPPLRPSRSSLLIKRTIDIAVAGIGLVLTAPLFAYVAWRIKRDTPGPVLFRQTRLGMNMREFTMLKFRTMTPDADQESHRALIRELMNRTAEPRTNGMYKLERPDEITPFGRWLRKSSLDELPQLINVLRGEMSLVGPRPCLPYEVEDFQPHHLDRFLVPAGMTGLWQVTARARSTFLEALEMDVAYARGWSLGLDLWLLARTPLQIFVKDGTT
jgi:exopolysaccharide biosynthesis polyprenyl glycosylphosphotransferase